MSTEPGIRGADRRRDDGRRDIAIWIVLLVTCTTVAACGGGSSGPAESPLTCTRPTPGTAAVPECGATSVCLPSFDAVTVDSTHCTAATCRWTYQVNLGDTLTFDGGDTWVFLRFAGSITGATMTEQLAAAQPSVNFYRTYPVTGGEPGQTAIYFEQHTGITSFDLFQVSNGRLRVKLSFTALNPYSTVSSKDPACNSGDIAGMCLCAYPGEVVSTIDVDLPADLPAIAQHGSR